MAQRLKRWESPRKEGRNDKGKGGSARQRQLKKRTQMLRQKLSDRGNDNNGSQGQNKKGENHDSLSFFVMLALSLRSQTSIASDDFNRWVSLVSTTDRDFLHCLTDKSFEKLILPIELKLFLDGFSHTAITPRSILLKVGDKTPPRNAS
jgi:hypothetical protein